MKCTTILALTILLSSSAFAAQQITREESAGYTKIGEMSIEQDGVPTVGNNGLSKKVDQKCNELGNVAASDCYYLVLDKTGKETNFQNIDIEIFKK